MKIKYVLVVALLTILVSCKTQENTDLLNDKKTTNKTVPDTTLTDIDNKTVPDTSFTDIDHKKEKNNTAIVLADTLSFAATDTIVLALENQFSLGKSWVISENSDSLLLLDRKRKNVNEKERATAFQILRFMPMPAGIYSLKLENKRPFDRDTLDVKTLNQIIIIQ
ncbi:MAG: hypothetical protein R2798_13505 [Chitinophagales bacterium]|nr:hypothetical protein [Bacteroidota bacterium]MCB9044229.1 hypothetical protein [Chitinophagales bacterium]